MYSDTAPVVRTCSDSFLVVIKAAFEQRHTAGTISSPRDVEQALGPAFTERESITHKALLLLC